MATTATSGGSRERRRGRLAAADRDARRREVLRAAMAEVAERGYERTTMSGIAARAGASKETLYTWFGDKVGLLTALIEANADGAFTRSLPAMAAQETPTRSDAATALSLFAEELLGLLTGRDSVALNRAAMSSAELSRVLDSAGRARSAPVVGAYLRRLHEHGLADAPDAAAAFGLFYGLVVQDTQIRVLLGGDPPDARTRARRAREATERFLLLTRPR